MTAGTDGVADVFDIRTNVQIGARISETRVSWRVGSARRPRRVAPRGEIGADRRWHGHARRQGDPGKKRSRSHSITHSALGRGSMIQAVVRRLHPATATRVIFVTEQ